MQNQPPPQQPFPQNYPPYVPQPPPQWQPPASPGLPPLAPPVQVSPPPPARAPKPARKKPPLGCVVAAIFMTILLCSVVIIAIATSGSGSGGTPTPTVAAQHQATTQPTAKPTTPTTASSIPATHGTPHIGGPLSDFVGAYGQPHNGDQFSANGNLLSADATNGTVDHVILIGDASWSNQQTQDACAVYLPAGATEFNTDAQYIDYHSSAGEIVMQVAPEGQCVLNLS